MDVRPWTRGRGLVLLPSLAVLVGVLVGVAATAVAQRSGEVVVVDRPLAEDLYLTGRDVQVRAAVEGDVVAAGRRIRVGAPVSDDVILAAESVDIDAAIGDDVRAAGRTVRLAAPVAGHVVAAGETVVIAAGQRVEDWAWLAGRRVEVHGSVGSLRATGDSVLIAGEVRGDADVRASDLRLAPGAVVRGDLRWSGEVQPFLAEGAVVEGRVVHQPTAADSGAARLLGMLFWIASVIAAVVVLFLIMPGWSVKVARTARVAPWRSLAAGLAVLLGGPIVIALTFLTGVLWILGIVLLAAYLLALVGGALLGVVAAGELTLDLVWADEVTPRRWKRVLAAAVAALTVALLALLPVAGLLVVLVLTIAGIGASAVGLWRVRQRPTETEALTAEPAPA